MAAGLCEREESSRERTRQRRLIAWYTTSTTTAPTTATNTLSMLSPVTPGTGCTWSHFSKIREEPASDDCANNAKNDVQRDAFSPLVDDLAADEARDETKDDPSDDGHDGLLALEPTGREAASAPTQPNIQLA